jgi:hypothetical protein
MLQFSNFYFDVFKFNLCGPGNSVGIATGYGLGGPGIESRLGRNFLNLSRPNLGPTQPPVHGYHVFPGDRKRPRRDADPSPLLVPRSKNRSSWPVKSVKPNLNLI